MTDKLIFLSHIHEERDLALVVKKALEDEFSGFVDVFVSSDGTSIPAGSNFLKRIEDGLVDCIGAIYLISPTSVKRNWVNFELGAVWIRNVISIRSGNAEVPAIPMCHSGMMLGGLPQPINNLNAILANQASQLEGAFRALQTAVGGRGQLKTDFDALAARVIELETQYTLGANLVKLVKALNGDGRQLVEHCEKLAADAYTFIDGGFVETSVVQLLRNLEANEMKGQIKVTTQNGGLSFTSDGAIAGARIGIELPASLVLRCKRELLA